MEMRKMQNRNSTYNVGPPSKPWHDYYPRKGREGAWQHTH
jgi:hypothetical protein